MTNIILILYLIILSVIAIGSFRKVKSYSDFFVARKKGSYWAVTGSLTATILGGSAVIGAIDAGKSMGWATSWFMLSAALGLLALLPFTKRVSRLGRFTLPDLLEDLYGKSAKTISSVIIPVAWLGIVAAQLIAAARILQSFTGLGYNTGVILSGIVFIAYTIAGGQLSVLKTDLIQAILIVGGLIILSIFSIEKISFNDIRTYPLSWPFNYNFKPIDLFILIISYSSTFTAGPDIYSRIFCSLNEKTAKRAVLTTSMILIPVAVMIGLISVAGALVPGVDHNGSALIELSQIALPVWSIPIIVLGLLSAVLSSADTTLLSASIITTDLVLKGKFNEYTLKTTRIIILFAGILAIIIASNFTSIIGMLLLALTVYSGAFIIPIIIGLANVKVRSNFVSAAVLTGGIVALIGKILTYTQWIKLSDWVIIGAFVLNATILLAGIPKNKKKPPVNTDGI